MNHDLFDPKKKTNKTNSSKNSKSCQAPKANSEEINAEASDGESKESSNPFIPPWLRNSLGLTQKNNLRQAGPDLKFTKFVQKVRDGLQSDFEPSKPPLEKDGCREKATDHTEISPLAHRREQKGDWDSDDVETLDQSQSPLDWEVKRKESRNERIWGNSDVQSKKATSKTTSFGAPSPEEVAGPRGEEKKRHWLRRSIRRNRPSNDSKPPASDKGELFTLPESETTHAKADAQADATEVRHLEAKLLLLNAKSRELSGSKVNGDKVRLLQEIEDQMGSVDEVQRVFEHLRDFRLVRKSSFVTKGSPEGKQEEENELSNAEDKCLRHNLQKPKAEKDSLLSTDDENDIKRFSEFLNTSKDLEEKRRCLEEVRNYFERKRRARQIKRRFLEEGKLALSPGRERKFQEEEAAKERLKQKHLYRGKKSKFVLCGEEVVEKAVDEALQKFVEMYHFRVSPTVMGNMKRNILQALKTDILENSGTRQKDSECTVSDGKKRELETGDSEPGSVQANAPKHADGVPEQSENEKSVTQAADEKNVEDRNLTYLKSEFDGFLNTIRFHTDVTKLKLQSVILKKEEKISQNPCRKNVKFIYDFTTKSLKEEKDNIVPLVKIPDPNKKKDVEIQTSPVLEPPKPQSTCDRVVETEATVSASRSTQTEANGTILREIKELKNCDITPGLYRMIRSKEGGKFYLYPEHSEDSQGVVQGNSMCSVVKDKKLHKKRHLAKVLSKERTRERQVFFKDRQNAKVKRGRVGKSSSRCRRSVSGGRSSISCLYFRNVEGTNSESHSSRREVESENFPGRLDAGGEQTLKAANEEHLGCFWFWNGEKITPGSDLKIHVESLLREKLSQFTCAKVFPKGVANPKGLENDDGVSDSTNTNATFSFSNKNPTEKNSPRATEDEEGTEAKMKEEEKVEEAMIPREKSVKSVGIQGSDFGLLSLKQTARNQSASATAVRRKSTRRNVIMRPHRKMLNARKAEDILKAIGKLKNMTFEIPHEKKENSSDSDSFACRSTSTSASKNEGDDPLSVVLGFDETVETRNASGSDITKKLRRLMKIADREISADETYDLERANSTTAVQEIESVVDGKNHLNLISELLCGFNRKEKERLWKDVRNFVKTKIGKDINDEGTREVCIEIEQDVPKAEQGKIKRPVLAKGHYAKEEGNVEVEIDLTLDDLARILRQRQRRIKKENLRRKSKCKNVLMGSTTNGDTVGGYRRYQWYLDRFAVLAEDHEELKLFKKTKESFRN